MSSYWANNNRNYMDPKTQKLKRKTKRKGKQVGISKLLAISSRILSKRGKQVIADLESSENQVNKLSKLAAKKEIKCDN